MTAAYLACLALGYLIGSLSVSILISKYIFHQDVRTLGSGNAGAANAARTLGAGVGLLTLLHDRALRPHLLRLQGRKSRRHGGCGCADD